MIPILQIGPFALPLAPFSILLMFWLGLSLAEKFAPRRGISADALYGLTMTGLITGLIAARIGFVFRYPGAFLESPLSLFSLNPGLLDPFSAISAALVGMLVYGQRARMHFWNALDVLTPLLAMIAVGIALSHIASGEAFGAETNLPWGIELWGAMRHPAQFYELVANVSILLFLGWKTQKSIHTGTLFLSFLGLQAGTRLFLETYRGDSSLILGEFRSAQILAWVILAAAFMGLEWIKKTQVYYQKEPDHG